MISGFKGKYRWLSNFAPCVVRLGGVEYPTTEHAYQAAKTVVPEERAKIREAKTPGEAKRLGKKVTMRPDWDDIKLEIMHGLQVQKYAQEPYRSNLKATGNQEIVESNTWGDTFWGECKGKGENNLGKIIMVVRSGL